MAISITDLQNLCTEGSIRWTVHVLKRLILRNISQDEVIQAIQTGEIIKQYEDDKPFPSCLILGTTIHREYLHVVCGRGEKEVWIITAYHPDLDEWEKRSKNKKEGLTNEMLLL